MHKLNQKVTVNSCIINTGLRPLQFVLSLKFGGADIFKQSQQVERNLVTDVWNVHLVELSNWFRSLLVPSSATGPSEIYPLVCLLGVSGVEFCLSV